jgi:hypothetical protein
MAQAQLKTIPMNDLVIQNVVVALVLWRNGVRGQQGAAPRPVGLGFEPVALPYWCRRA